MPKFFWVTPSKQSCGVLMKRSGPYGFPLPVQGSKTTLCVGVMPKFFLKCPYKRRFLTLSQVPATKLYTVFTETPSMKEAETLRSKFLYGYWKTVIIAYAGRDQWKEFSLWGSIKYNWLVLIMIIPVFPNVADEFWYTRISLSSVIVLVECTGNPLWIANPGLLSRGAVKNEDDMCFWAWTAILVVSL